MACQGNRSVVAASQDLDENAKRIAMAMEKATTDGAQSKFY